MKLNIENHYFCIDLNAIPQPVKAPRLVFIDMARSIAILLMLEGHITGELLSPNYRALNTDWYNFWQHLHGYTSPLFFTISGIVFAYLLTSPRETDVFWKNTRVRKGFKRVFELMLWGYLLQLHLRNLISCWLDGSSYQTDWLMAFHVLQSIGVAIFLILVLFGFSKWSKLHFYYWAFAGAFFMLLANGHQEFYIKQQREWVAAGIQSQVIYRPEHWPKLFQNFFFGQYSDFSFIRFSGYTLFGAGLGHLLRTHERHAMRYGVSFIAVLLGYILVRDAYYILWGLDFVLNQLGVQQGNVQLCNKDALIGLGYVLMLLGVLVLINRWVVFKDNIFLRMGQNTLLIYIVHVMLIYEGLLGYGLPLRSWSSNFSPLQSWGVSGLIIIGFFLMVSLWTNRDRWFLFKK